MISWGDMWYKTDYKLLCRIETEADSRGSNQCTATLKSEITWPHFGKV